MAPKEQELEFERGGWVYEAEFKDETMLVNPETPETHLLEQEEEREKWVKERHRKIAKKIAYYVFSKVLTPQERNLFYVLLFSNSGTYEDACKKLGITKSNAKKIKERIEKKIKRNKDLVVECNIIFKLLSINTKHSNPFKI